MTITRFGYLDHLRCLAILGVVAAHTSQSLGNPSLLGIQDYSLGRFGVQLFFLVSGSTVWLSLESCKKNFKQHWIAFYIKRGFRIIPLFFFFSFTVFMARGFLLPSYYFNPFAGLYPDSINIVPGGWSIWNEIYFYLGLPIYAFIRQQKRWIAFLGTFLSTITLLIGLNNLYGGATYDINRSNFDYLNVFTQFIFFQIGLEITADKQRNIVYFFCGFFAASLVFKLLFFHKYLTSPDYGSGVITSIMSIFLSILFILTKKLEYYYPEMFNSSISNFFKSIGRATYTMYVIHFGVIWIISRVNQPILDPIPSELLIAIVFFVSYYVSVLIKPLTEEVWTSLGGKILNRI